MADLEKTEARKILHQQGLFQCNSCQKVKEILYASKRQNRIYGHIHKCKSCMNLIRPKNLGLHKNRIYSYEESSFRKVAAAFLASAKRRKISCSLTIDEIIGLSKQNCYFCGIEPSQLQNYTKWKISKWTQFSSAESDIKRNGIDRIDSNIGYHPNNVVACCWICNRAKSTLTLDEFKSWLTRIAKYFL